MAVEVLYYLVLNVFLISVVLIAVLFCVSFFVNWKTKEKSVCVKSPHIKDLDAQIMPSVFPENDSPNNTQDEPKPSLLPERLQNQIAPSSGMLETKHIRRIIRSVVDHERLDNGQNDLAQFWEYHRAFFYKRLNMHKMLLLEVENATLIKVFRYVNFSIDLLFRLEEELNSPRSALRKILLEENFFCFRGKLSDSKYFRFLFHEFEYAQYDHVYVLPVSLEKTVRGVLLLFQKSDQEAISQEQLRMIMNDVFLVRVA